MNYKKLTIKQLQDQCFAKNLSEVGKKDDLIKRLIELESREKPKLEFSPKNDFLKNVSSKEDNNTLFIQVKYSNIPHYFNCGVIYPLALEDSEIYKNENRKKDIFTQFPEHIIFSPHIINSFEDDEVLLEVIINNLNVQSIEKLTLSYTSEPIPISRIKKILFKTQTSRKTFISSIKTFPDSFIPDELCHILPFDFPLQKVDLSKVLLQKNSALFEWKEILNRFDKIMGIFSFKKNAGTFLAESENRYQEYTQNYFSALSMINSTIKVEPIKGLSLYKYMLFPLEIDVTNGQRFLFKQIMSNIQTDITFDQKIAYNIIQNAISFSAATPDEIKDLNVVLEYFTKWQSHQIAFKDILMVDEIKTNYPVLALFFLSKFSNKSRQHTDKQAVRNIFILNESKLGKNISEFLLGVLGLYYGYKTMIKQDTNLRKFDSTFNKISEQSQSIKFKLETALDRVTIESIFNFCRTNKTITEDYSFLNFQSIKNKVHIDFPSWGEFDYKENSYTLCNTKITVVERKHKSENLLNIVDQNYSEQIKDNSLLAHYLISTFGLNKKVLLDLIKANVSKLDLEKLRELISLDQRLNNNR